MFTFRESFKVCEVGEKKEEEKYIPAQRRFQVSLVCELMIINSFFVSINCGKTSDLLFLHIFLIGAKIC